MQSAKTNRLIAASKAFKGSTVYVWCEIISGFLPCVVQERAPLNPNIKGTRWMVSYCASGLMRIKWDWENCRWQFDSDQR